VWQIADTDRQYFQDHALTLAGHPSETEERMDGTSAGLRAPRGRGLVIRPRGGH